MKNEFVTIKIWKKTLSKLRLIAAVEEKSMSSILDKMVTAKMPVDEAGRSILDPFNVGREEYIKKLERRIHNQRVALRRNWEIIEQRAQYRDTPLRSMWFEHVKRLALEVKRLREKLGEA